MIRQRTDHDGTPNPAGHFIEGRYQHPRVYGFDYETSLIQPALLAPPPVCMSYATRNLETGAIESALLDASKWPGDRNFLKTVLDYGAVLVGANVPYDLAVAINAHPELIPRVVDALDEGRVFDTHLNQALIDNGKHGFILKKYSLLDLGRSYLNTDRSEEKNALDAWRLRYWELRDKFVIEYPEAASKYALDDSIEALLILEKQFEKNGRYLADASFQTAAAFSMHLASCWGIRTNAQKIELFAKQCEEFLDRAMPRMIELGFLENKKQTRKEIAAGEEPVLKKNIKAIRAHVERAYQAAEMEVPRTATNEVATDKITCAESLDDDLMLYSQLSSKRSILESDIPKLRLGIHTPLQTRYRYIKATGRSSSYEGEEDEDQNGTQMHNPRTESSEIDGQIIGVRECYQARPGYVLIDVDFGGLELSTVAEVCIATVGFSTLGDAINRGIDPHLALGATLLGISYEEAKLNRREKRIIKARSFAKIANFGFPGGLGIRGLLKQARQKGVKMTRKEAEEIRSAFLRQWPEFNLYFEWIRKQIPSYGGKLRELTQLVSGRIRANMTFTEACNTMFQGLGADVMKRALWEVTKACIDERLQSPLYGSRVINQVHDQIITETPIQGSHAAAMAQGEIMCWAANTFYLQKVPVKAAPCLSFCWSKNAVDVYDASGHLLPWDWAHQNKIECFDAERKLIEWK